MKPLDLAMKCKEVIESGQDYVQIVMPRCPRGENMYLAGRRSPLSKYTSYLDGQRTLAGFRALDVLAWLHAHGAVKIVPTIRTSPTAV